MKLRINSVMMMGSKLILMLLFTFTVVNVQAKQFDVELKVNSSQDALEINDAPTKHDCNHSNAKKGCMRVKWKKNGDIRFKLESEVTCGGDNEGLWQLTEVYLGGKNHPDKPGTGDNPVKWGNLDPEVQKHFEVANYSTGRLKTRSPGSQGQSFRIYDKNKSVAGYFIYYRVEAMCIADDIQIAGPIVSDPRIVNEGEPER